MFQITFAGSSGDQQPRRHLEVPRCGRSSTGGNQPKAGQVIAGRDEDVDEHVDEHVDENISVNQGRSLIILGAYDDIDDKVSVIEMMAVIRTEL